MLPPADPGDSSEDPASDDEDPVPEDELPGEDPVPPPCIFGPFGAPELVTGLGMDEALNLWAPALSPDGLSLYFAAEGANANEDLYVSTRPDVDADFSAAMPLASLNSTSADGSPFVFSSSSSLVFFSERAGGQGSRDLWQAPLLGAGAAEPLASLNSSAADHLATLSADGLTLLFVSTRAGGAGGSDIWRATRPSTDDDFGAVENLTALNTTDAEGRAQISADGLSIYFDSRRPGSQGGYDLWFATRATPADEFSDVTNLAALNSTSTDTNLSLSPNELELYFASSRSGQSRLMRSVRACE